MFKRPDLYHMEGDSIILDKLSAERHFHDLFEQYECSIRQNPDIFKFMFFGAISNGGDFLNWLETQEKITDRLTFAVYSKRIKKYVGMFSILNVDENHGRAELGSIWYGVEAQRTEINSETTFTLLKYLFEELGYRRVEWKCDNENIRSKRAAERLGFVFEGVFRKHMIANGKNRDTAWYAIIDDDWSATRKKIEDRCLFEAP